MKTLFIFIITFACSFVSAEPSKEIDELLRVLDLDTAGGSITEVDGEMIFPPTLETAPASYAWSPKVVTLTTTWKTEDWKSYIKSNGFSYATPSPVTGEDIPVVRRLFENQKKELCRSLELPRLGRIELVATVDSSTNDTSEVTFTILQKTFFYVAPSE